MKVIILLSVISLAFASRQCGENQHYDSCGTACPLTCKNYDNPPVACVLMCNPGCHCDEGYVKTEDGRCVRPEECPARTPQCGENQHYESCGTACPLTCKNYDNPPVACVLMCNPGCHCDKGYVKTEDGRCVRPEQCSARAPQCGENQHYTTCGTACPLTCSNYNNPPKACVLMCKIGCECDKGFVQTSDGRCVRSEECPARTGRVCGENQRFQECGTPCPLTCDNYDNPPKICPAMCVSGCHCETGYVKTRDGRCVRPEQCPARVNNANRQSTPSFCQLPAETGVCDAYFTRFYFDNYRGECMRFVYGGCGGNSNNFKTIDECQKACA